MEMKVLITGGIGCIGLALAKLKKKKLILFAMIYLKK